MRVQLVVPPPVDLENGNRRTALRWAAILAGLGHDPFVQHGYETQPADLLVALHAVKNYEAMRMFRADHRDSPVVVALTGTDIYGQEHYQAALDLATRVVVLQARALEELDPAVRERTRVIYQSAAPPETPREKAPETFQIAVIGHLRGVKDPFRTALATRSLPPESKTSVVHVGRCLDPGMEGHALREMAGNPRYVWIGEQSPEETERILASSHLLVISSRHEGSSNVLSEALAAGVPVIASRIPGLLATLGPDYSGYYEFGDTGALSRLLLRAEVDARFYRLLETECRVAARLVSPERERDAWRQLLSELWPDPRPRTSSPG